MILNNDKAVISRFDIPNSDSKILIVVYCGAAIELIWGKSAETGQYNIVTVYPPRQSTRLYKLVMFYEDQIERHKRQEEELIFKGIEPRGTRERLERIRSHLKAVLKTLKLAEKQ